MSKLSERSIYDVMRDCADTQEQLVAIDTIESVINLSFEITSEFIESTNSIKPTFNNSDLDFTKGGYTGEGYPDARKEHVINKP